MIARVVIDLKVKTLNRLFDYFVAPKDQNIIEKGMRVSVPFGNHDQKRLGYVIDIINESEHATKEVIEVLDIIPTLTSETFKYINFLLETNNNLLINAIETVIPSELFLDYYKKVVLKNKEALSENLKLVFGNKTELNLDKRFLPFKTELKRLINKKVLTIENVYKQRVTEKTINIITYQGNNNYARYDQYLDLISFVKNNENLTRTKINEQGYSLSSVNTLIKNDVFKVEEISVDRKVEFLEQDKIPKHILNQEQKDAFTEITNNLGKNKTYLLHGITGSGKTEVYMQVMKKVLENNQKVLYLVPEIALIAPLMRQLRSRFNENITHYNSNISVGERYDAYQNIINNKTNIIVGTRSAVFLPINDLGLIIIDEEHDHSFIQTERIEYKTIDIAMIKAKLYQAPVILGSATPSVNSMYKALNNEYKLLKLTKRATKKNLPLIHYVDMKEELKLGNTKIFSNLLYDKINDRLKKNEQVILLFNRKGYAPFIMCRQCGHIPNCPKCDVSLTYYKSQNELKCHHCGHFEDNITVCPVCESDKIRPIGVGIEHIESEVKKHFKTAKTIRMDATTTTRKGSHEAIWNDFKDLKYNILIGTQMVSKGLDFPNVTLVGILMADMHLKVPSYFASEKTYALLTQMSGRSGRKMFGESIIQGYNLDHYAIKAVDLGYDYFYKQALYERKLANYIPFYNVVQILVTSKSYLKSYQVAFKLKKTLKNKFKFILGPAESIIRYIKDEYRFVITIKDKKINHQFIFDEINKLSSEDVGIYFHNIPEIL